MLRLIFSALGLATLILDSKTAFWGATKGIELCVESVIPSLFPMMIFSMLITGNVSGGSGRFRQKLCQFFGIPSGTEALLLTGLIGGYPIGAKCINRAFESGHLDRNHAERMLGFCNNAGPAFIFGMASSLFQSPCDAWALWIIHILSALITGLLLPRKQTSDNLEGSKSTLSFANAVPMAVKAMASVCGWVIIFRMILTFLDRWLLWFIPDAGRYFIYGIIELTNGINGLFALSDEYLRFIYASVFLSLGGFSVLMQTASSLTDIGLGFYIPGKILQTGFSTLCSLFWVYFRWQQIYIAPILFAIGAISCTICCIHSGKNKITVAFPMGFVYNSKKQLARGK